MWAHRQRGVSLIEALVAFAIMAFGMMAVIGMQGTMRGNSDLARQRAEAVRLAQDAVEEWRGFTIVEPPAGVASGATTTNRMRYQAVDGSGSRTVTGTNATYTISRRALARTIVAGTVTPEARGLLVEVSWVDRSNQTQTVRLSSAVAGLAPDLSASLVLATATDPAVAPQHRNRAIPRSAVPVPVSVCTGCSGYVPPGQSGSIRDAWMFNNLTAEITVCSTTATTTADLTSGSTTTCGTSRALLLSGFVTRAPNGAPATDSADDPGATWSGSNTPFFTMSVRRTSPTPADSFDCFLDAPLATSNAVPYVCAIPLPTGSSNWSGRVEFGDTGGFRELANDLSDNDSNQFKVCRYSPPTPASYTNVATAQINQNFLVIQAGSSGTPFSCPGGTPATVAHDPD
ncbi:prepilin-type N-terminal cleavage/methylation domain-containing protein [Rubrivivax sp. A210]|uniref:prepilin-type N-terminal cleavage/methylation domain-containing protein n=1 Tax=Rubrivivax sp. A210 TaxID=2772301 RepID=UPI0019198FF1|nr:prepilin-type N-terminal cleavage/methylation domain-containing protein [Rubrivivax sp. A210]